METLLNMKELAALLGLKLGTVKKKVQANEIPHIRISDRCVRFERDAVLSWIASRRVTPVKKPLSLIHGARR